MDEDNLDEKRRRELAEQLDCLIEEDLQLLAGITAGTLLSWRKRGTGPAYVLIGNRYLYPRVALKEFLETLTRARAASGSRPAAL